jgi:transcriptional regulator with GAF, ATPase, and Fis domain
VPHLLISRGERFHKEWVFSNVDIITIGRAPANDIVLSDPHRKVSRCHAAIVRAEPIEERYFVRDLGSLMATKVGGDIVYRRLLEDGDVIRIADYELVYCSSPAEHAPEEGVDLIDVLPEVDRAEVDRSTTLFSHQGVLKEVPLAHKRMEVIEELLKKTRGGGRLEELFEALMDPILHALDAVKGFVGLFPPDQEIPYQAVGLRGLDPRSGERIRIADPAFLDRLREGKTVHERTTLLAPILVREEAVGFLCLQRSPSAEPFSPEDRSFLCTLGRLAAAQLSRRSQTAAGRQLDASSEPLQWPMALVGKSEKMRETARRILSAASTDVNVLLLGETGTGKGVVARAIHEESARHNRPFINVDLTNLPATLAESELFGYRRGAFSDAKTDKKGRFELAHKGTIFLDEIGALSPDLQAKLLKPIAEKEITRLGDEKPIEVDVRVIAATNKILDSAVAQGTFARDLYRRINNFRIQLPPLREHKEDIPLLAFYFLDKYAKLYDKQTRAISHRAMRLLARYNWPGNIGELEGYIAAAVSEGKEVLFSWDFPAALQQAAPAAERETVPPGAPEQAPKSMEQAEKEHILEALEFTSGNITKAAEILKLSRQTVLNKMDQYGIPRRYQRSPEESAPH